MQRTPIFRLLFCALFLTLCAGAVFAQEGNAVAPQPIGCECNPGSSWNVERKSCVAKACDVPKMPDGDKGGGYFSSHGVLYVNTPCRVTCVNLNLNTATGQPGWKLVSGPGSGYPITPVVVSAFSGWATLAGASWIAPDANRGSGRPAGDYVYEYEFCLGPKARGPRFTVNFLADNGAKVFLNSSPVLFSTNGNHNFSGTPSTFTWAGGNWIVPGVNKVRIVVWNESSVTGLAATLNVRAECGACEK